MRGCVTGNLFMALLRTSLCAISSFEAGERAASEVKAADTFTRDFKFPKLQRAVSESLNIPDQLQTPIALGRQPVESPSEALEWPSHDSARAQLIKGIEENFEKKYKEGISMLNQDLVNLADQNQYAKELNAMLERKELDNFGFHTQEVVAQLLKDSRGTVEDVGWLDLLTRLSRQAQVDREGGRPNNLLELMIIFHQALPSLKQKLNSLPLHGPWLDKLTDVLKFDPDLEEHLRNFKNLDDFRFAREYFFPTEGISDQMANYEQFLKSAEFDTTVIARAKALKADNNPVTVNRKLFSDIFDTVKITKPASAQSKTANLLLLWHLHPDPIAGTTLRIISRSRTQVIEPHQVLAKKLFEKWPVPVEKTDAEKEKSVAIESESRTPSDTVENSLKIEPSTASHPGHSEIS